MSKEQLEMFPEDETIEMEEVDAKGLTTSEYRDFTRTTDLYSKDVALIAYTNGICSEAGELVGKVNKMLRGDYNLEDAEQKRLFAGHLLSELGDVVWFVTRLTDTLNVSIEDVMAYNKEKLEDRLSRDKIKGSGDNR